MSAPLYPSCIRFVYPKGCLNPINESFSLCGLDWECTIEEKELSPFITDRYQSATHESTIKLCCRSLFEKRSNNTSAIMEALFSVSMETEAQWDVFLKEKMTTKLAKKFPSDPVFEWTFQHRKRMRTRKCSIEIQIEIYEEENNYETDCTELVPHDSTAIAVLELLDDDEIANTADVVLKVKETTFYAHQTILKSFAPRFADFCEKRQGNEAIVIDDMSPLAFNYFLRCIYGDSLPNETKNQVDALMKLHRAADKYQICSLKRQVEYRIGRSALTVENAIEIMCYAIEKEHTRLKDLAMAFFTQHADEVIKSQSYVKIKDSPAIMQQFIEALILKDNNPRKRGRVDVDVKSPRKMILPRLHCELPAEA